MTAAIKYNVNNSKSPGHGKGGQREKRREQSRWAKHNPLTLTWIFSPFSLSELLKTKNAFDSNESMHSLSLSRNKPCLIAFLLLEMIDSRHNFMGPIHIKQEV